jgi:hypothetical protein
MAELRRMICSQCEFQSAWTDFGAEDAPARCPKCGGETIRFADYEPSTYGGLTADQWERVRSLVEREMRSGLLLVGQQEELAAILAVAEEEALPAIAAIDEVGVFGYLEEATAALEEAQQAATNGDTPEEGDWSDEAREELLVALEQVPGPLRETLVELIDGLCEALAEQEGARVASVAVAAGLGGELERDTGSEETEASEGGSG